MMFLKTHYFLGDYIVCNGLIRGLAEQVDHLMVPVKGCNMASVNRMFEDLENVEIVFAESDPAAVEMGERYKDFIHIKITDERVRAFDKAFYDAVRLPLEYRWSKFHVPRKQIQEQRVKEALAPKGEYIFLHDDPSRGFAINLKKDLPIIRPVPELTQVISNYWALIEDASEIHCISSSFAQMIEAGNIGKNRFLHSYARRDGTWCSFRNFNVL